MSVVVTFNGYVPPVRFDDVPWTKAEIEESPDGSTSWAQIDLLDLPRVDTDPSDPQPQSFTTTHGTAPAQWYRIIYEDDSSGVSAPTAPVQNVDQTVPYATTDEFFRIIKKQSPSDDQVAAALGDLQTATLEINDEIDFAGSTLLSVEGLALCKGVCLDRAADLWRHRESAPGILGVVDEGVPSIPGRYSFARYTARLSVLKEQWGIA